MATADCILSWSVQKECEIRREERKRPLLLLGGDDDDDDDAFLSLNVCVDFVKMMMALLWRLLFLVIF